MAVSFTDDVDPLFVETITGEEEEASDFEDDAASMAGSEISMSEFEGPASALPRWCLFGPKECRCIFVLNSDRGALSRVCGNVAAACTTRHTPIGERAEAGYYEPIKARKYYDGKLHTFLSLKGYAAMEQKRKEAKASELQQASTFFKEMGGSPSGSEEAAYARFQAGPNAMEPFNDRDADDTKPTFAAPPTPQALKEPPRYDYGGDVKPRTTPRPLKSSGSETRDPFLGSPTLKSLQGQGVAKDVGMPALSVAMMGMMDELAKSVSGLATQVDHMESGTRHPELEKVKRAPPSPHR